MGVVVMRLRLRAPNAACNIGSMLLRNNSLRAVFLFLWAESGDRRRWLGCRLAGACAEYSMSTIQHEYRTRHDHAAWFPRCSSIAASIYLEQWPCRSCLVLPLLCTRTVCIVMRAAGQPGGFATCDAWQKKPCPPGQLTTAGGLEGGGSSGFIIGGGSIIIGSSIIGAWFRRRPTEIKLISYRLRHDIASDCTLYVSAPATRERTTTAKAMAFGRAIVLDRVLAGLHSIWGDSRVQMAFWLAQQD